MPAVHDGPGAKGLTIAAAAHECLKSFHRCLETTPSINPQQLSMIEEQTAIFRGWTTSAAVFESSSVSMDYRLLQYAPEVHSVVTGLLVSLNYRCQECESCVLSTSTSVIPRFGPLTGVDLDSRALIRKILETGQEDARADGFTKPPTGITAEINRLIKISNNIRRASKDTLSVTTCEFYIKNNKGFDVEGPLLEEFRCHVNARFPKLGVAIQDRLARAMLVRRRRILYRKHCQDCQDDLSADPNTLPKAKAILPFEQPRSLESKMDDPITKAATTNPSQMKRPTISVIPAKRTFALWSCENLIFPPAPGHTIERRYDQLTRHQRAAYEEGSSIQKDKLDAKALQEVLSKGTHGLGEIHCPYCLCLPPVGDVFDEAKWRDHVMDDLDAYVCVFEDCDQSSVLYTHADQWLNHLQQHRKVWRCPSHRDLEPFPSSEGYITHLREVHATKLSERKLQTLASKVSLNAKLFPMCPLCGRESFETNESVETHVAGHLRLLALESLPSYHEDIPAFELYRLVALSECSQGCQGRKLFHIERLLDCAYPSINIQQLRLDDYSQREPRTFFSRARLNKYFEPFVNELLDCKCWECKAAKDDNMDRLWTLEVKRQLQSHPWILGFMIFLGKLHYLYYWVKWGFFDSQRDLKPAIMEDVSFQEQLIKTAIELPAFKQTYLRAVSMFHPIIFEIQDNGTCPYRDIPDSCRFPFLNAESILNNGFYRAMTKVEILPEHLNRRMINLITERYPTPGTYAGRDRKLLFALKSVTRNPSSPLKNMDLSILNIISLVKGPASNNIITPLIAYNWKDQIHFLFPLIEMNLDHVLRNRACPGILSSKLGPNEQLSNHWLWREMKGVCYALSLFHKTIKRPSNDNQGFAVGLHLDLKPANILVTTDKRLKITDFRQRIIQILGTREDMTAPQSPETSRFTGPESRPTLYYSNQEPEEIGVLLNYDVWSLGCIMVEVLIHLMDLQTLDDFDRSLGDEQQGGFFTGTYLKQCVNASLEDVRQMFRNGAERHYMATITDLIRAMLRHNVKDRPYSWQVFDELQSAELTFMALSRDLDRIGPVKGYELQDASGFRELGWDNGKSIVSFADMVGVTLELVRERDGYSDGAKPCQIRLFRKSPKKTPSSVEIALVWGVEKGGRVCLDQRRFEASRSYFSPTYLIKNEFDGNTRFQCRLFPTKASDLAFIFEFKSLEDVLIFQGTLMHRKIFPPIRARFEEMTAKTSGFFPEECQGPVFNPETSHIQLWADCTPTYLRPAGSNLSETKARAPSIPGSSGLEGPLKHEQCNTMAVFAAFVSPLIVPLNDGRKVFEIVGKSQGKPHVKIASRKSSDHDSYLVRQPPARPVWPSQGSKEAPDMLAYVLLETDYERTPKEEIIDLFEMDTMKFILENSADYERLQGGTEKEWRGDA